MPKVLHVSFLWDDEKVNQRHSDYNLALGWVKEGWDVLYYDYRGISELHGNHKMNEGLIKVIKNHDPDIVFFTKFDGHSNIYGIRKSGASCKILPDTLNIIKRNGFKGKMIHWFLDQRVNYYPSTLTNAKYCDWFFYVCAGERLNEYHKMLGIPCSFVIAPTEPSFLDITPFDQRHIDILWTGGDHKPKNNNFEDTRYEILSQLVRSGYLKHHYGCFGKHKVWCPEYQKLIGQSLMGLSLYAFDRPMYFSNRLSHLISSNTALISYDFKDRQRIFSDEDGIFFKTVDEFKKKSSYYLKHIDELECIANNGYDISTKYFSSQMVVKDILTNLTTGSTSLPFGETYNTKKIKYDIPKSENRLGDIYTINVNGIITSIDKYSKDETPPERPRKPMTVQFTRRAKKHIGNRRVQIQ